MWPDGVCSVPGVKVAGRIRGDPGDGGQPFLLAVGMRASSQSLMSHQEVGQTSETRSCSCAQVQREVCAPPSVGNNQVKVGN